MPDETEQGYALRVETRASARRQQEQAAQQAAADEQANQARTELLHLEEEAKKARAQAHAAHPEAPMTDDEKRQLVQSLIESFEKYETIDYKLIREIERKYPVPSYPRASVLNITMMTMMKFRRPQLNQNITSQ